jgi:hypothetical protein
MTFHFMCKEMMDLNYCLCILVFTFFVRIVSPLVFVCFSRVLVVEYLSIFLIQYIIMKQYFLWNSF